MKTLNIRPLFKFRFIDHLKGSLVFIGIMLLINILLLLGYACMNLKIGSLSFSSFTTNFNAYGFSACIVTFVYGICTIREDLRLGIQHGIGRKSVLVSSLASSIAICFVIALAGELILAFTQALSANSDKLFVSDLYQVLYNSIDAKQMSFGAHIEALLFSTFTLITANLIGMFISLVFFRLNKVFTVVVAVGVPVFFFMLLPIIISYTGISESLSRIVMGYIEWLGVSVWNFVLSCLIISAITAVINWLMIRRAPISGLK